MGNAYSIASYTKHTSAGQLKNGIRKALPVIFRDAIKSMESSLTALFKPVVISDLDHMPTVITINNKSLLNDAFC